MDYNSIKEMLTNVGNKIADVTASINKFVSGFIVDNNSFMSKLIAILILLLGTYLVIKLIQKPLKWAIVILLIILAISVGLTFIG